MEKIVYIEKVPIKGLIPNSKVLLASVERINPIEIIESECLIFDHVDGDIIFEIPPEWEQAARYLALRNRAEGWKPIQLAYPFKVIKKMVEEIILYPQYDNYMKIIQ